VRITWGVAEAPMLPGTESGDSHVVKPSPEGVLAAVIDGVGHGNEAADAARIAGRTLSASPHEDTVSLVWRCHEALKQTRGVVMTLVFFSPSGAMTWVGVGNIEGVIFRCDSSGRVRSNHVVLRGGVVGHRLPPLRAESLTMLPHDTIVLATDGIRPEFSDVFVPGEEPQAIADQILARYRKGTDDALVLVVRCLGDGPQ
jgi:serine/threonine protein phosphatase PrpC